MRLFLAVPVPVDLSATTVPLLGQGFRAVPDGSWHMTVRFLGEAEPDAALAAMDGFAGEPMQGHFTQAGAFPDERRARVAWLGVAAKGLDAVAAEVRRRMAGIGQADRKDFAAHVTLGRWKRPMDARAVLQEVSLPPDGFAVDRVDLMASELTPHGPRYSVVRSWPLG